MFYKFKIFVMSLSFLALSSLAQAAPIFEFNVLGQTYVNGQTVQVSGALGAMSDFRSTFQVTITNRGTASNIGALTVSDFAAGVFSIINTNCPQNDVFATQASCLVNIGFQPGSYSPYEGRLSINFLTETGEGTSSMIIFSASTVQSRNLILSATGPATAHVNDDVTYQLAVRNESSEILPQAVLSISLPSGVDYVSSNPSCQFTLSARLLSCSLSNLAAMSNYSQAIVLKAVQENPTLSLNFNVSSNFDIHQEDNSVSKTLNITPAVRLDVQDRPASGSSCSLLTSQQHSFSFSLVLLTMMSSLFMFVVLKLKK